MSKDFPVPERKAGFYAVFYHAPRFGKKIAGSPAAGATCRSCLYLAVLQGKVLSTRAEHLPHLPDLPGVKVGKHRVGKSSFRMITRLHFFPV